MERGMSVTKRCKYLFENTVKFLLGVMTGIILMEFKGTSMGVFSLVSILLYSWFVFYTHNHGRKTSGAKCNSIEGKCRWEELLKEKAAELDSKN